MKEIRRKTKSNGHFLVMFLLLRYLMTVLVKECHIALVDESQNIKIINKM
jgi:hypothetical protein